MKLNLVEGLVALVILGFAGCGGEIPRPALTYYHGQNPPDAYFEVVRYTPREVEFKVKIKFASRYMYHLILEGDQPLAEGWHVTILDAEDSYRLVMKAKKEAAFEAGKSYRLCIGKDSPEYVARYRSSYQCAADYTFVLPPQ